MRVLDLKNLGGGESGQFWASAAKIIAASGTPSGRTFTSFPRTSATTCVVRGKATGRVDWSVKGGIASRPFWHIFFQARNPGTVLGNKQ